MTYDHGPSSNLPKFALPSVPTHSVKGARHFPYLIVTKHRPNYCFKQRYNINLKTKQFVYLHWHVYTNVKGLKKINSSERWQYIWLALAWFMVVNATFTNISVISWRSVLLVEETGVPGENLWSVASHWQTVGKVWRYQWIIKCRTSKKDRQFKDQNEKDKQWCTKLYTEN